MVSLVGSTLRLRLHLAEGICASTKSKMDTIVHSNNSRVERILLFYAFHFFLHPCPGLGSFYRVSRRGSGLEGVVYEAEGLFLSIFGAF